MACNLSTVAMPALRLPAVNDPLTPQLPTMVHPDEVNELVVTCVACSTSVRMPFVTSWPRDVVTGFFRLIAIGAEESSNVATFGVYGTSDTVTIHYNGSVSTVLWVLMIHENMGHDASQAQDSSYRVV